MYSRFYKYCVETLSERGCNLHISALNCEIDSYMRYMNEMKQPSSRSIYLFFC